MDKADNTSIGTSDHQKRSKQNHESTPCDHGHPALRAPIVRVPVVVDPHDAFRLETEEGSKERTDKGHQAAEGGNAGRNAVGDDGCGGRAAEPGAPVGDCVGSEMVRAAEDAEEDVFRRDLEALLACAADF